MPCQGVSTSCFVDTMCTQWHQKTGCTVPLDTPNRCRWSCTSRQDTGPAFSNVVQEYITLFLKRRHSKGTGHFTLVRLVTSQPCPGGHIQSD